MPSNLFSQFRSLIPTEPLLVGTVTEVTDTGAVVELPGGSLLTARGTATLGGSVFVRAGVIQGEAPSLPLFTAEV